MELEQFKSLIPQLIATCVAEQKETTVLRAAELVGNFALTHSDVCYGRDAGFEPFYY